MGSKTSAYEVLGTNTAPITYLIGSGGALFHFNLVSANLTSFTTFITSFPCKSVEICLPRCLKQDPPIRDIPTHLGSSAVGGIECLFQAKAHLLTFNLIPVFSRKIRTNCIWIWRWSKEEEMRAISSAKHMKGTPPTTWGECLAWIWRAIRRGFIKTFQHIGPSSLPWGAPDSELKEQEWIAPLIIDSPLLSYSTTKLATSVFIPSSEKEVGRTDQGNESKALAKSK